MQVGITAAEVGLHPDLLVLTMPFLCLLLCCCHTEETEIMAFPSRRFRWLYGGEGGRPGEEVAADGRHPAGGPRTPINGSVTPCLMASRNPPHAYSLHNWLTATQR